MESNSLIAKNKKALFDYQILEKLEAGIVLSGPEVKSAKNGGMSIADAFVRPMNGELWLWNSNINQYKFLNEKLYDAGRSRKLLLRKKQRNMLMGKVKQENLAIVPLRVYLNRGLIKVEIALAKGKREYEKRKQQQERDQSRELGQEHRKYGIR